MEMQRGTSRLEMGAAYEHTWPGEVERIRALKFVSEGLLYSLAVKSSLSPFT